MLDGMSNEEAIEILRQIRKQSCVSECNYTCKLFDSEKFCREEKALDLAIKALEQQTSEDCISRQYAIEYLCTNMNWYDEDGETADDEEKLNAITDLVNGVPSVTPQPRWIPVSERLPEDGRTVLVWFEYYRYGDYNRLFQTFGLSYAYGGHWSGFVNGESGWKDLRIIAWMPLPQPYKAESEE